MSSQNINDNIQPHEISGKEDGERVESRVLEELIQQAVVRGYRQLHINSYGQHGIGGRLWRAGDDAVHVKIFGHPGQRIGSMGFANTFIEVMGPASDDVGWLNGGAEITIHGNAGNGTANGMAQGKIYVAGNIGARGMTMTKHNPRFDPPELWVLGSAGDYFGEFMAGGVAVVCGQEAQDSENILGYRPLVGMVGGKVFFRGSCSGYSEADAKAVSIGENDWRWLLENLKIFLDRIGRSELLQTFADQRQWQLLEARNPHEKLSRPMRSMGSFYSEVWEKELGRGGLIGDLNNSDRSPIPVITSGALRRFVPVWEDRKYAAPCEAGCPTGIPVQERWRLIREGRVDEAVDLALAYTPFPASVCGYLCPNLCMQSCTRQISALAPVDVTQLGQASISAKLPEFPEPGDKTIAVIGGGPSGISVAWQLRRQGHQVTVYDVARSLGGKITRTIPQSRIPEEVITREIQRVQEVIAHEKFEHPLGREDIERLKSDFDFVVIATGAQKARTLPVPGNERALLALDFLTQAKSKKVKIGKRVVIIGAGNVGCDVAIEADRLGAEDITLLDVQEPASFGKERAAAEAVGVNFRWPVFTREITDTAVVLTTGEAIPADTVVISIGDVPDLDYIPESVATRDGFVEVNDQFMTSDPKIFALGDVVKPGLLTDAIGAGRAVAQAIDGLLEGGEMSVLKKRPMIRRDRVSLEYFDPRITEYADLDHCGSQCSSCGACRDCGICIAVCPRFAISRKELEDGGYEYAVDERLCIGCGFCAGACPCGVWDLVENDPIE